MEYMMRRGGINHINGSRLFVYKMTRNLLGWTGDQGGYLRKAIQAVSIFGVPPEEHWPYEIERYEEEPAAFHYAYADNFRALNYARLDPYGIPPEEILTTVKRTIYAGYAVVFGFTVFSSLTQAPDIAFPDNNDSARGGHAVMAVGYDDHHAVNGQTVPSLVIRNSWGRDWGGVEAMACCPTTICFVDWRGISGPVSSGAGLTPGSSTRPKIVEMRQSDNY